MNTKIILHTNSIGLRGTDKAIFDYSTNLMERGYDVKVLANHVDSLESFRRIRDAKIKLDLYFNREELLKKLDGFEYVYNIKYGGPDNTSFGDCKELVHAVFDSGSSHGFRYAAVSEWLAKRDNCKDYVPHIVQYEETFNLRDFYNIPEDAYVLGYHGGDTSFDIGFVKEALNKVLPIRSNLYMLLMGVKPEPVYTDRMIYIPGSISVNPFISTCNAMLHARGRGETFGLSVAEFALAGKPILTYGESSEKAHLEHLKGDPGLIIYNNETELEQHLLSIDRNTIGCNPNTISSKFSPENVMNQFEKVFLN